MHRCAAGLVALLAALLAVAAATPVQASNDPYFNEQWGLQQIGAPAAWSVSTGGGVTIGIVDSGAQVDHPDFGGRVRTIDCSQSSGCGPGGDDRHGHGTHVTGIAAATKDDGQGIAGVAPAANVVVANVFRCNNDACSSPTSSVEAVTAGVRGVIAQGARVVNLSLGDAGFLGTGLFCNNADFGPLLNEVWAQGVVPVLAAGNCGGGLAGVRNPSGVNALIVGATVQNGSTASYSGSLGGAKWGLVAPGGAPGCTNNQPACVLSTWKGSAYAYLAGTSMAAPHVTGAIALLLSRGLRPDQAVSAVMGSLDGMSCGSGCQGRLNIGRAIGAAAGGGGPVPPVPPPVTAQPPPPPPPPPPPATTRAPRAPRAPTPAPDTTTPDAPTEPEDPVLLLPAESPTTSRPGSGDDEVAQPAGRSDPPGEGPGAIALVIAVGGLLAAGAATALAGIRYQRLRGGGAL